MNSQLSDTDTYIVLTNDPTKKLTTELHSLLTRWIDSNYITPGQYKNLNCTVGIIPRAYGLPKIHKNDVPLRIIVSSLDSPLYNLSSFLHSILKESIPLASSFIKNSYDLVDKLFNIQIDEHLNLISLDVLSLFTNVPIDLAITNVNNRWTYISKNTFIPANEFLTSIKFILNTNFFNLMTDSTNKPFVHQWFPHYLQLLQT